MPTRGNPNEKPFRPEHLDEARQRRALIEALQAEVRDYEARAQRARLLLSYAQEAMTAWLAYTYHLHPERGEQWHLDIEHLRLLRIPVVTHQPAPPPPPPSAPPSPPSAPAHDA
jgi:hypothetical protein